LSAVGGPDQRRPSCASALARGRDVISLEARARNLIPCRSEFCGSPPRTVRNTRPDSNDGLWEAPRSPADRSVLELLILIGCGLALDRLRAGPSGRAMASRLAPPPMEPTFGTTTRRSARPSSNTSTRWCERWRRPTHCGVHRGFTANWANSASASRSERSRASCGGRVAAVPDMADVSDQSRRYGDVDRFLHRPRPDRPSPLRVRLARASSAADCPFQHHRLRQESFRTTQCQPPLPKARARGRREAPYRSFAERQ
jgi:hypothetical protein